MTARMRTVAWIKTARLVVSVAMLFAVVAGALGYDLGVQTWMATVGGTLGIAVAALLKASYLT